MALGYLLDTNICIYIARRRPPEVLAHFERLRPGEVAMSLITFGELRYGAQKSARNEESLAVLQRLTEWIPVLTPAAEVGKHYGEIRADLERAGLPIGNNDLWIAAHARALGVTLVSNDTREFDRVIGLSVANWATP
jgi:tRNA(fMet)-specific endonuclease VapC